MNLIETSGEIYQQTVLHPFSKFETAAFAELNRHKTQTVRYFIFNNGKNRFGLVGGEKNHTLCFPFSATYGIFSEICSDNRIAYYHQSVQALLDFARMHDINKIQFNTPALCYGQTHITKFQNALAANGFCVQYYDVNFEFYLKNFDENYLTAIKHNARKNYHQALAHALTFEKTTDVATVYRVIKINREHRGFPLRMTQEEVVNTAAVIPTDFFLIKDNQGTPCAAAVAHRLQEKLARVVYWGNTPQSELMRPVNFLSYNLFSYYKNAGLAVLDIGTATENGIPNEGLCDFKDSIGCTCSPKLSWIWENRREK